ncbi:hypothetical protein U9M48_037695, partial [Paspalum notatum var. saurae]
ISYRTPDTESSDSADANSVHFSSELFDSLSSLESVDTFIPLPFTRPLYRSSDLQPPSKDLEAPFAWLTRVVVVETDDLIWNDGRFNRKPLALDKLSAPPIDWRRAALTLVRDIIDQGSFCQCYQNRPFCFKQSCFLRLCKTFELSLQWCEDGLNGRHVIILLRCMNPPQCGLCRKLRGKRCFLFIIDLLCFELVVASHRTLGGCQLVGADSHDAGWVSSSVKRSGVVRVTDILYGLLARAVRQAESLDLRLRIGQLLLLVCTDITEGERKRRWMRSEAAQQGGWARHTLQLVLEAGELDADWIGSVEEVDEVLHLDGGLEAGPGARLLVLERRALAIAVRIGHGRAQRNAAPCPPALTETPPPISVTITTASPLAWIRNGEEQGNDMIGARNRTTARPAAVAVCLDWLMTGVPRAPQAASPPLS